MYIAIIVIFLVLIALMGMRAWFMVRHDQTKRLTFWEAVNQIIDEDGFEKPNNHE